MDELVVIDFDLLFEKVGLGLICFEDVKLVFSIDLFVKNSGELLILIYVCCGGVVW